MIKTKYPRTPHLWWSPGMTSDDKRIKSYDALIGLEVVVTIKMDGENTTGYPDGSTHARSLDSRHHLSRDWFKQFWGERSYLLPDGHRVCGENLYAKHSLSYDDLPSYFMGFSVWDSRNTALSWSDTLAIFQQLGIEPVTAIYQGPFDLKVLQDLTDQLDTSKVEGIVVRSAGEVPYDQFDSLVAKWVRPGHVQADDHWMNQPLTRNQLTQRTPS